MSTESTDNWGTVKNESVSVLPHVVVEYIKSIETLPHDESYLINTLHKLQEVMGYLGTAQLEAVSQLMQIPSAKVVGVASFYHYFRLKKTGKFIIRTCMGTACYVKGASPVVNAFKEILRIEEGETTPDGIFTLEKSRCLGVCSLAPVVMINEDVHAHLKPELVPALIEEYRKRTK
jgi:NADH:ubiquinone oxidoreductase subunit E